MRIFLPLLNEASPFARWSRAVTGLALSMVLGWILAGSCPVFAASATTVTMTVTNAGSLVTNVSQGAVVTLTATVLAGSTPVTTGQIHFCDAAAPHCTDIHLLGTAQLTSGGTATFRFRPGAGSHNYQAIFLGTNADSGSSSTTAPLSVSASGKVSTATSVAISVSGGSYTLTSTVGGSGTVAPTGTLSFLDTSNGNAVIGSSPLSAGTGFGFINFSNPIIGLNSDELRTGDFNGDGIPDLVAATNLPFSFPTPSDLGYLTILLGNGDGSFTPTAVNPAIHWGPGATAVGDFNGDGISDLAVVNELGTTATILLGNGDGTFRITTPIPATGVGPYSIAVGDFNGDGIADLAVGNSGTQGAPGTVTILLGKGDGTFTPAAVSPTTGLDPLSIAAGDFNGDGICDLAVVNDGIYGTPGTVTILLGNGDGTFTATAVSPTTGVQPISFAVADLNRDGNLDLAVCNYNDNDVTVLLGDGHGNFSATSTSPATGVEPVSLAIGDFNGDGIVDLIVADSGINGDGNTATVLLGNGDGTFATTSVPAGADTEGVVVADFNGDGLADAAVQVLPQNIASSVTVLLASTETSTAMAAGIPLNATLHVIDANYPGDSNYAASVSQTVTVNGPPATTTLGLDVTPSGYLINPEPVTLTATLSPSTLQGQSTDGETITFYNGTAVLGTGTLSSGTATLVFTPTGTYSYNLSAGYAGDAHFASSVSIAEPLTVGPPIATTLTVGVTPSTIPYGAYSVTMTGTLTPATWQGHNPNELVTFTDSLTGRYLGSAPFGAGGVATYTTCCLPVGHYQVQASFPGDAVFNFATSSTVSLTVAQDAPTISLTASPNPGLTSTPVTFTADLSSYAGTLEPEIVAFYDGTTQLGLGALNLSTRQAAYTTSALTVGSHSITAVYVGDSKDLPATSAPVTVTIENFALGSPGGGSLPSQTVSPGGQAVYTLAITPPNGTTLPAPTTFSVTGLPAGATATFSPTTLPANSGPTNVTMTVTLPAQTSALRLPRSFSGGTFSFALGLILLPFAGGLRRGARRLQGIVCVLFLGLAGAFFTTCLSGCGSSASSSHAQAQTYTLTITATSGALSNSTTASLIVQ